MSAAKPANRLVWRPQALADRERIFDFIAADNPVAAIELDEHFEAEAERARQNPLLYRPGRVRGTRELVAHPNYVMVYRVVSQAAAGGSLVEFLRVLHARQQWP